MRRNYKINEQMITNNTRDTVNKPNNHYETKCNTSKALSAGAVK